MIDSAAHAAGLGARTTAARLSCVSSGAVSHPAKTGICSPPSRQRADADHQFDFLRAVGAARRGQGCAQMASHVLRTGTAARLHVSHDVFQDLSCMRQLSNTETPLLTSDF